jgi:Fic family protein
MRIPANPPPFADLMREVSPQRFAELATRARYAPRRAEYFHWDRLRRLPAPDGLTHHEWWLTIKVARHDGLRDITLTDASGRPFRFSVPEVALEALHTIDVAAGGKGGVPGQLVNHENRNLFLASSLVEEAITSSQLEGAATTRKVAAEMIRTGRKPRDVSERMILNNYRTMQRIRELKESELSPELVFEVHRMVTEDTLDDPTAAGRFRRRDEEIVVSGQYGEVVHTPPIATELPDRMALMCDFANNVTPDAFVHPVVRGIILHFWLAFDHPFVDGNGRTARAMFYWSMLRQGYWPFEFVSISHILRKAPLTYVRSFLYTETDDNDLTYFVVAQADVIIQALKELSTYIDRKTAEAREAESTIRSLDLFNHRQSALIIEAVKSPGRRYTIKEHQHMHSVVYQTARTDLHDLANRGVLELKKKGKELVFRVPSDIGERLERLEGSRELQRTPRRSRKTYRN